LTKDSSFKQISTFRFDTENENHMTKI